MLERCDSSEGHAGQSDVLEGELSMLLVIAGKGRGSEGPVVSLLPGVVQLRRRKRWASGSKAASVVRPPVA